MRELPLRKRRSRTSRLRHSLFGGSRRSSKSESVDSESSQWTDCSASTEATDATEHERELSGQEYNGHHHKPVISHPPEFLVNCYCHFLLCFHISPVVQTVLTRTRNMIAPINSATQTSQATPRSLSIMSGIVSSLVLL